MNMQTTNVATDEAAQEQREVHFPQQIEFDHLPKLPTNNFERLAISIRDIARRQYEDLDVEKKKNTTMAARLEIHLLRTKLCEAMAEISRLRDAAQASSGPDANSIVVD